MAKRHEIAAGLARRARPIAAWARGVVNSRAGRVLLPLSALALALWLVRDQIKQIEPAALLSAIGATPRLAIVLAALFTALSYASLAVVEWQALAFIGRPQSCWRTAIAACASNALSVVMGFGLLSGTAVRLRAYAFAKLKAADVGRLVLLLSASTILAGVVTEGLTLPFTLPRLLAPSPLGWVAGAACLLLLGPAILWFTLARGKKPRRTRFKRTTADRAIALAAALGDWIFSGAALFILSSHDIGDFPSFLAVFCLGSLASSIVGVPAGIGVLDAVILGLSAGSPVHETAAALILFRAIYFAAPLLLTAGSMLALGAARIVRRLMGLSAPHKGDGGP